MNTQILQNKKKPKHTMISAILKFKVSVVILFIILGIELFPIVWVILTSFKSPLDITCWPPRFLFFPSLSNYRLILQLGLLEGIKNSCILGTSTILITFIIGSPFAYLIARYSFKHRYYSWFYWGIWRSTWQKSYFWIRHFYHRPRSNKKSQNH